MISPKPTATATAIGSESQKFIPSSAVRIAIV